MVRVNCVENRIEFNWIGLNCRINENENKEEENHWCENKVSILYRRANRKIRAYQSIF